MAPTDLSLWPRASPIDDVKNTFSSWDSCMAKSYCKWPVIVAIIVGSLIVLGVAWCIIGCLCCGYNCCKSCCSCCCPSGRDRGPKRSKYADNPTPFHNSAPAYGYQSNPPPPVYEPQNKFAQFDAPLRPAQPVNEDALPPMPSWSDARTRRVEDHSQDMEMNNLDSPTGQAIDAVGRPGRRGYYEVPSSPGLVPEGYRGTETTAVPYRQPSPVGVARTHDFSPNYDSPYTDNTQYTAGGGPGGMYPSQPSHAYTRSPVHSPPPPVQTTYSPYPPNDSYNPYSSSLPSSPPSPFRSVAGDHEQSGSGRPPTVLIAGRKPVEGSWRDV
ncbi:hypothetical protein VTO42DRAFT_245 [Malbranchea cinnamomea]